MKSGLSTILSCLSPRSPCWGPNAAVRRKPAAASASRLWVRSRVTEGGGDTGGAGGGAGNRGGVSHQGDALAFQRGAQFGIRQQPFDTQFHSALTPSNSRLRTAAAWKSGLPGAKTFDQ